MTDSLGTAVITIGADTSGLSSDIESSAAKSLGSSDAAGQSLGTRMGSGFKKALKVGVASGAASVAAVATTALVKGFNRLKALDEAKAKMRGLFTEAEVAGGQVEKVMENVKKSVQGTAFGLGEAATVAAAGVAAGIKPGEALTEHLSRIANNAAAAGVTMDEMGRIFNKAATQANGVQNDVISQLADKGIPIYQALADQMGVTAGEVFKMASQGKIDFDTFSKAAKNAAGTVAEEMGGTLTGSLANMMAALGRIGANFLDGVYQKIAPGLQWLKDQLSGFEGQATKWGEAFSTAVSNIMDWLGRIDFAKLREDLQPVIDAAIRFKDHLLEAFDNLGPTLSNIRQLIEPLAPIIAALGGAAVIAALDAVGWAIEKISNVVRIATHFVNEHKEILSVLAGIITTLFLPAMAKALGAMIAQGVQVLVTNAAWGVYAAVSLVKAGAAAIATSLSMWKTVAVLIAQKAWLLITKGAMLVWSAATKGMAAAQWLLNAAMTANPIGLIIAGIVLLVAAIVILWKKSETFRNIVIGAWNLLKTAVMAVVEWFKATIPPLWEGLKNGVSTVFGWIVAYFKFQINLAKTILIGIWSAIQAVIGFFVKLYEGAKAQVAKVIGVVTGIKDKVLGVFKSAKDWLLNAGKDIMRGLSDGISRGLNWVKDKIKGLGGMIPGWLKSVLGIASPSKVLALDVGRWIPAGIAEGINANTKPVQTASESLGQITRTTALAPLTASPASSVATTASPAGFEFDYRLLVDALVAAVSALPPADLYVGDQAAGRIYRSGLTDTEKRR